MHVNHYHFDISENVNMYIYLRIKPFESVNVNFWDFLSIFFFFPIVGKMSKKAVPLSNCQIILICKAQTCAIFG